MTERCDGCHFGKIVNRRTVFPGMVVFGQPELITPSYVDEWQEVECQYEPATVRKNLDGFCRHWTKKS